MNGYRSLLSTKTQINPYTVSIVENGEIRELGSSVSRGYENNQVITSNIIIGNNVEVCDYLFNNCTNLNLARVIIPDSVEQCVGMFENTFLNSNINIPKNAKNCAYMFCGCRWYYDFKNIYIPENVISVDGMFSGITWDSYNKNINVYFNTTRYINIDINGMFGPGSQTTTAHLRLECRRNIFFNSILNNVFNRTDYFSIANNPIAWTPMTNGFYNSYYNFYMYNNL